MKHAIRDIHQTVMTYIDVRNALKCAQNVEMMASPEIKIDVLSVMRPHIHSSSPRRRAAWSNVVSASLKYKEEAPHDALDAVILA